MTVVQHRNGEVSRLFHRFDGLLTLVQFELTLACNLRCVHCYSDSDLGSRVLPNEHGVVLTSDEIVRVVQDLSELGSVLTIGFIGGEPLVRRDLEGLVAAAYQRGFLTTVATNGTLLSDARARALKEAGLNEIQITLLGASPQTNDALTLVLGSFQRAVEGIRRSLEAGLKVRITSVLMSPNVAEIEEIQKMALNWGCEFSLTTRMLQDAGGFKDLRPLAAIDEEVVRKLLERINGVPPSNRLVSRAVVEARDLPEDGSKLIVTPTGNVIPHFIDRRPLGNVREESIKEIWRRRCQRKR